MSPASHRESQTARSLRIMTYGGTHIFICEECHILPSYFNTSSCHIDFPFRECPVQDVYA